MPQLKNDRFRKYRIGRFMVGVTLKRPPFFNFFFGHSMVGVPIKRSHYFMLFNFEKWLNFFLNKVACARFTVTGTKSHKKKFGRFAIVVSWHVCTKRSSSFRPKATVARRVRQIKSELNPNFFVNLV